MMNLNKERISSSFLLALSLLILNFLYPPTSTFAQTIEDPWIKEPMPTMKMTAAYMTIRNDSSKPMTLIRVTGEDCKSYEIHTHEKIDGVMKMRQIKELNIPAKSKVTLKPKSFHIMMIQLKKKLSLGEKRKLTLHFNNGKKITLEAPVRKP